VHSKPWDSTRPLRPSASRASFHYSPWVVANLELDSDPVGRGFPTAWDNVLYESESLGYVVATHQIDRTAPETVWTWYRPHCGPDPASARTALLAARWEDHRDEVLTDLRRAHPRIEDRLVRLDVWRWGHAMIRPEPGFLFGSDRERAAEEVLSSLGMPFRSSL
jgi:hypothetical protein